MNIIWSETNAQTCGLSWSHKCGKSSPILRDPTGLKALNLIFLNFTLTFNDNSSRWLSINKTPHLTPKNLNPYPEFRGWFHFYRLSIPNIKSYDVLIPDTLFRTKVNGSLTMVDWWQSISPRPPGLWVSVATKWEWQRKRGSDPGAITSAPCCTKRVY